LFHYERLVVLVGTLDLLSSSQPSIDTHFR
jgi:hypothetical protein